jgi:hypothetical protein
MSVRLTRSAPSQWRGPTSGCNQARWPVMKVAKMANRDSDNPLSFIRWWQLNQSIFESARKCLALSLLLMIAVNGGWAQEGQPANAVFVLPAGTKLPLRLLRPLRVKAGQDVYLQITFPVTVGNQMLIPPGAYLQGKIEKIIKKDRRSLQFSINSANLIFFNGYTVPIGGTVTVSTTNAALVTPQPDPDGGQSLPAMAAVGGVTPPPLPPLPSMNGARNAMIGLGVAAAVGTTVLIVLAHNRDPEIEVGTPLEIILPAPVYLDAARVAAAIQQTRNAPVQIVKPPVKPKMCYDPGTPGTPDTVIPGSPGTPDTVIPGINGAPDTIIPGTPRTPDTVIPGAPGTPSSSYPCP